ncbi:putative calpain [Aspergillus campestris IBT 28561]|uniref:Calpain n=1 Tax=Aspergillus campestris (strain IBT 28561) TaxID=1392248 RepID=A0A2I1CZU3_ASPC2|nr:putative calpain [Aspergillus campestris IBT 28561]PKY03148.1 putative calpain [Aspergillus campestris IBT 28561]
MVYTPDLSSRSEGGARRKQLSPQETLRSFWDQFYTKSPGKVYTVLPDNPYARTKAAAIPSGVVQGQEAGKSYEQVRRECERAVDRIARECERLNQKYTDPHFDIEVDLKNDRNDCLYGLDEKNFVMRPRGVKRVTEIFDNPQFYVNGPTASDVRQGRDGDCWFMAALCTMGNKEGLIEKICVARNERVGVYGFVFYRDGEWQQCLIDDKLYLRSADYDESIDERHVWDDINRSDAEEEYRKVFQTGSRALYFARCADENETWLPLLEKAYAKAHGDYSAIEGGFVGEAIEDLTGGVTSDILSSNILDKDRFWREDLMKVNKDFLFGCGTGLYANWLDPKYKGPPRDRKGISENHSYSIMEAKEIDGQRLLRLRNPWGKKEWTGAWSDGSEQWTPQWMEKLGHKFGNDGFFWISYNDLLKKYQHFDRTRLFDSHWTVVQQWTTLNVPWSADYLATKFLMTVTKGGPQVIVLSQLDPRYFKGLRGEYDFLLKFRIQKEDEDNYIVRSHSSYLMSRSVNTEVNLEPGRYHILMKITAYRYHDIESTEEVVSRMAPKRREKLVQIGLSYDLAHAKGLLVETDHERQTREEIEERRKHAERKKLRADTKKRLEREWIRSRKMHARKKRTAERLERLAASKPSPSAQSHPGEQILPDGGPVQSPADLNGNFSPDLGGREKAPNSIPSIPTVRFNGIDTHGHRHPRRIETLRSSIDTTYSNYRSSFQYHQDERELLEGFEFDSDLDMPCEEPSAPTAGPKTSAALSTSTRYMDDECITDPWNAVCVIGLRVYSKDPQLSLQVVRPMPEDEVEATLDMDDPAASATSEKGALGRMLRSVAYLSD